MTSDKKLIKNLLKGHICSNCKYRGVFIQHDINYRDIDGVTLKEIIENRTIFNVPSLIYLRGKEYSKDDLLLKLKTYDNGEQIPFCRLRTDMNGLPKKSAYTTATFSCQFFWEM